MFADLRLGTVLLITTVVMVLAGILFASVIITASSVGSSPASTAPASLAAATRSLPRYWVVRPGDTLTSIASKTRLEVSQLQQLNPKLDASALLPGQRLRLHPRSPRLGAAPR